MFYVFVTRAKPRTPVIAGDLVALFEPSEGPLEAFWGIVGAYAFNMLTKAPKQRHCRKRGETYE